MTDAPLFLLRKALQTFTAHWQAAIPDVTPPQYTVLYILGRQPGLDQSRLGELASIDLATLTVLLGRLEDRGYLVRRIDPENRRRKLLSLTEAGGQLLDEVRSAARQVEETALRRLSATERAALPKALRRIADNTAG